MKSMRPVHLTRRASLTALLASGVVGALSHAHPAEAKQNVAKKAKKKCQQQQAQCASVLSVTCNPVLDCPAVIEQCCAFAGRCDITGFFTCAKGFENQRP